MSTPTADQKRWERWCRESGCVITGGVPSIHHIKGREMKLKGVDKAGHWYIIPIVPYWHKHDANKCAIHSNRKAFEFFTNYTEKEFFIDKVFQYEREKSQKPMSDWVFEQIVLHA